jgi:hypothetical protein
MRALFHRDTWTKCQRDVVPAMTTPNQKLESDRGARSCAAAVEARRKKADARAAELAPIVAALWAGGITSWTASQRLRMRQASLHRQGDMGAKGGAPGDGTAQVGSDAARAVRALFRAGLASVPRRQSWIADCTVSTSLVAISVGGRRWRPPIPMLLRSNEGTDAVLLTA